MSEAETKEVKEKPKPIEGSKIIRRTKDEHNLKKPKLIGK